MGDKRMLPKAKDRISFLYVDKARIEQTEYSIQIIQSGRKITEIPISTIAALFLGPGTTITHMAIKNICDVGCSIIWCGECGWRFYASGTSGTNSSKNILKQMEFHESKVKHLAIVRKMYQMRYPGAHLKSKSIAELRGFEGHCVQNLYYQLAEQYGVEWDGRKYEVDDFESQTLINQCLTFSNQILYGIIRGVLHVMGFSTAIGYIHTGHMDSFVFDIADLYKENLTIPTSFKYCSKYKHFDRKQLEAMMRKEIVDMELMKKLPKDILSLFEINDCDQREIELLLWDGDSTVEGGKNYDTNI
jgi:CRISPR-associated protein Cas1